jgi:glycosyltransferase involved in cell wall biosynthesis
MEPGRRPIRVLCFSSLYPNAAQPVHGIFVENRLRHLLRCGGIEARVVAPVPWFPLTHRGFGGWADYARVPARERRFDIDVEHPRFPVVPRIGMRIAPYLMYAALLAPLRRLAEQWDFDVIDAHYFYPDGVAAALLARALGKPLMITARGTDISLIPRYAGPRRRIVWAARQASALVAVCAALKREMTSIGIDPDTISVLRNGVDLDQFQPRDRAAARRDWQVEGKVVLSVGHLIERKGHHLIIEALADLADVTLLVAGGGPDLEQLTRLAERRGVGNRVRFLGAVPHQRLPDLYAAADLLVLASSREGWANVLLEAMACGTPAAATDVWGTAEVVADPAAGWLIPERSAQAIAATLRHALGNLPDRAATRRYAEGFDWGDTSRGQLALLQRLAAARPVAP